MDVGERSRARFVAGDPLRAIAALGVVFGHSFSVALFASGHGDLNGQAVPGIGWLQWPVANGQELVFLFFALSGYLIGRPFIRSFVERSPYPSPVRYLKHRFLRIVPAYWVVLTIALLWLPTATKPLGPVLEAYFFLLDWYQSPLEGVLTQAWSLRIEMRFYLALPVVAALLIWAAKLGAPRIGRTARCWIVIGLSVIWGVGTVFITGGANPYTNGAGVLQTAFAFAPGLMLAAVELLPIPTRILRHPAVAYTAGVLALIAGSLWLYPWVQFLNTDLLTYRFREMLLLTLIVGGLLVWQWSGRRTWVILDNPVLRWAGSRSYGIYLIHLLVLVKISEPLAQGDGYKRTFAVLLPATLLVSGIGAELLYRLVERPALGLKDISVRDWLKPRRRARAG